MGTVAIPVLMEIRASLIAIYACCTFFVSVSQLPHIGVASLYECLFTGQSIKFVFIKVSSYYHEMFLYAGYVLCEN